MAVKSVVYNEVYLYFEYGLNISNKTLYLGSGSEDDNDDSEIDANFAEKAIKGLDILDNLPNDNPINVILNGYGGDYYFSVAIYDFIKRCKHKVNINVFGPAMSGIGVILQSGNIRGISRHSKFMLHYGTFAVKDSSVVAKRWFKELENTDVELENIYMERILQKSPDFNKKELQEMLKVDTILTASETVSFGLADLIL